MNTATQAYVLHSRPFKDAHLIVDLYTEQYGRVSVLARNVKGKTVKNNIWQSFILLELTWQGKGDLPTVISAEAIDYSIQLQGTSLFCGFYLNELLQKLIPKAESCKETWRLYSESLRILMIPHLLEPGLRRFELGLLQILGLGINFDEDVAGNRLVSEHYYQYQIGRGWLLSEAAAIAMQGDLIMRLGDCLITHAWAPHWEASVLAAEADLWRQAKYLTRQVLHSVLGSQTLQSRQLFAMMPHHS